MNTINIIEREAYFLDYSGNEQIARIRSYPNVFLDIDTFYKSNNVQTGYIRLYFHPNNRLYLDTIYCYDEFRGNGIATIISNLADYILSDYQNYLIRGVFQPTQMSTDRINNIIRSANKLDERARNFYKKAGYEIIDYDDYKINHNKYLEITEEDFDLGEERANIIVVKKIIPCTHPFIEESNIIYHKNYKKNRAKKLSKNIF